MVNIPLLVEELNRAIVVRGVNAFNSKIVTQIAELFVTHVTHGPEPDGQFDDVFAKLLGRIEAKARAQLSNTLSRLAAAPPVTSRCMALDDDVEIAQPMLEKCSAIDTKTLITVASTKSQAHLQAMARRERLEEKITDILVDRGERAVIISLLENRTARLSDASFSKLVKRSEHDDPLGESLGRREDIPREQCFSLLVSASFAVRNTLEKENPSLSPIIYEAVIDSAVAVIGAAIHSVECSGPLLKTQGFSGAARLGDRSIRNLAANGYLVELIAALSVLSDLPVQRVESAFANPRSDALFVLAKAIGLSWPTLREILYARPDRARIPDAEIAYCEKIYANLPRPAARKVLADVKRQVTFTPPTPQVAEECVAQASV